MSPTTQNSDSAPAASRRVWERHAQRLSGRYNLALWLDYFVPLFAGSALASAVLALAMRTLGGPAYIALILLALAVVLILAGLGYCLRNRFSSMEDGLVQLDIDCRLHNRLSAASAGIGPWPRVPASLPQTTKWRWERVVPPILCSVAFLWAAFAVKVSPVNPFRPKPEQQPMAWTQTESWLDALKEEQLVEERVLEQFEAKLEELKSKDAQEWYSHGSLEAGDNLKQNVEQGMLDLQNYLKQAQELLESARATEGKMSEATMEKVEEQYQEALKALENGMLPADQQLTEQMKQADPKQLSQMSQEQFQQMMQRIQQGQQTLSDALQNGDGEGLGNKMADMKRGSGRGRGRHTVEGEEGWGDGEGEDGENPGRGGITRGRGDAPLTFEDAESLTDADGIERLRNDNFDRALPSDMVGMSMTEPEVDPTKLSGPQAGGALISSGRGGEAVWRETLTPEEKEFLGKLYQ